MDAVLGSGKTQDRTTLLFGLDLTRNFGTPDIPRCEEIAAQIETLRWQRQIEKLMEMRIK